MLKENLDLIWLLIASLFVFFIQIGFLLFEIGINRNKNYIYIFSKYGVNFLGSLLFFWFGGFSFAFIGDFFLSQNLTAFFNSFSQTLFALDINVISFFLFQVASISIITSVLSLCFPKKINLNYYTFLLLPLLLILYSFICQILWSDKVLLDRKSWMINLGFYDFAGGSIICFLIGCYCLAILMSPENVKKITKSKEFSKYNRDLFFILVGFFFITIGWFAYIGGNANFSKGHYNLVISFTNMLLSSSVALIVGMILEIFLDKEYYLTNKYDFLTTLNYILGGLVIISANANIITPLFALFLGIVSSIIVFVIKHFIKMSNILNRDNIITNIFLIFLICGAVSTLLVSFTINLTHMWYTQLLIQILALLIVFIFGFVGPYYFFRYIKIDEKLHMKKQN